MTNLPEKPPFPPNEKYREPVPVVFPLFPVLLVLYFYLFLF